MHFYDHLGASKSFNMAFSGADGLSAHQLYAKWCQLFFATLASRLARAMRLPNGMVLRSARRLAVVAVVVLALIAVAATAPSAGPGTRTGADPRRRGPTEPPPPRK